jgi:hypothetical protein
MDTIATMDHNSTQLDSVPAVVPRLVCVDTYIPRTRVETVIGAESAVL